jgi:hypothetical protein
VINTTSFPAALEDEKAQAADAHRQLEQRTNTGRLILTTG